MNHYSYILADPAQERCTLLRSTGHGLRRIQEAPAACRGVDHYHVWADLRPGTKDIDFVDAVHAMMGHLQDAGHVAGYRITRRKLGFGPPELGEFHVDIEVRDLAQLDAAFGAVAPRSGRVETLHAAVWSRVVGLRTALYRDFPDVGRKR